MNIAFFGSPEIAKELLESIHKEFSVHLVVSQPDKPVGRKKIITSTPVSQFAKEHNIELTTPKNLDGFKLENIDIAIVVAYGLIIPKSVLNQAKYGFINVHYSLLPKYRGASPVQSAILNGDSQTGVTIMKIDKDLDHGEIIYQMKVDIEMNDTTETLLINLTYTSKPLLETIIKYIEDNQSLPKLTKQDHSKATYCERISKEDAFVEYSFVKKAMKQMNNETIELHNKIRAYYPWPIVWAKLPNGKRCKLVSSEIKNDRFLIKEIQVEGKRKMSGVNEISNVFR